MEDSIDSSCPESSKDEMAMHGMSGKPLTDGEELF